MDARRLIDKRKSLGRSIARGTPRTRSDITTSSLVRTYQKEVERQKLIVRKADLAQQRLLFLIQAFRRLVADENFVNLLRAEGLDTMPKNLADSL
jgi:ParB family chromosome partitioning protein